MNNLLKVIFFTFTIRTITSCSEVLQTIELRLDAKDKAIQQNFDVIEKLLRSKKRVGKMKLLTNEQFYKKEEAKNAKPIPEKARADIKLSKKLLHHLCTKLVLGIR